MKQLILCIAAAALLSSCSGWDGESKESFKSSCISEAKGQGMDEAAAKSMCDCRLEKIMKKYPNVDDALANMDKIAQDPEVAACK